MLGWRCGEEDVCAEANEEDGCCGGRGPGLRFQSASGKWIKEVQCGQKMALDDRGGRDKL